MKAKYGIFHVFATTVLMTAVIISCNRNKEKTGIAFTFGDISVNEWYKHRSLFKKYNIHATFFISNLNELDSSKINRLKILASDGHEIACHGYNHTNAIDYPAFEDYINQEINPALQKLQDAGFTVTSFAYPFGTSTLDLDSALLKSFKTIRKATYNIQNTTIDNYPEIYAGRDAYRIVNAMGIDYNYGISPENFETGIKKARKNKEVLIVYAHVINTSKGIIPFIPNTWKSCF